jgi:hypothetical protein
MMTLRLVVKGSSKFVRVVDLLDTGKPDGEERCLKVNQKWDLPISSFDGTTTGQVHIDVAEEKDDCKGKGKYGHHEDIEYVEEQKDDKGNDVPYEIGDKFLPKAAIAATPTEESRARAR